MLVRSRIISQTVRERPALLQILIRALKAGIAAPRPDRTLEQEANLQSMLMAKAREQLLTPELDLIARCSRLTQVAVTSARQQNSQQAFRALSLASSLASPEKLSPMALLLCKGPQEAAEAFHDYKDGDLIGAKRHLLLASAADEILESEYGLTMLHWHRVHLMNNLVAVQLAGGEPLVALQLACTILCYLQGDLQSVPGPGKWNGIPTGPCYQAALKGMFVQTCMAIAPILELFWSRNDETGKEMLDAATQQLRAPSLTCDSGWEPRAHAWFKAKLLQLQDSEEYILALADLLTMGPGASPLLWKSALKDCKALTLPAWMPEQEKLAALLTTALGKSVPSA